MAYTTITDGTNVLAQDNEVLLDSITYPTDVPVDSVFTVYFNLRQSPIFLGGLPTDPDYCSTIKGGTGRKVRIEALIDGQSVTGKTVCVSERADGVMNNTHFMDVPFPADLTDGPHDVSFVFTMADSGSLQFPNDSYNTSAPSTFTVSIEATSDGTNGGNGGNGDPTDPTDPTDPDGPSRRKLAVAALLAIGAYGYMQGEQ